MSASRPAQIREGLLSLAHDCMLLAGFGAVCFGVYSIYPPAAWIVGGGLLLLAGIPRRKKGGG